MEQKVKTDYEAWRIIIIGDGGAFCPGRLKLAQLCCPPGIAIIPNTRLVRLKWYVI